MSGVRYGPSRSIALKVGFADAVGDDEDLLGRVRPDGQVGPVVAGVTDTIRARPGRRCGGEDRGTVLTARALPGTKHGRLEAP